MIKSYLQGLSYEGVVETSTGWASRKKKNAIFKEPLPERGPGQRDVKVYASEYVNGKTCARGGTQMWENENDWGKSFCLGVFRVNRYENQDIELTTGWDTPAKEIRDAE